MCTCLCVTPILADSLYCHTCICLYIRMWYGAKVQREEHQIVYDQVNPRCVFGGLMTYTNMQIKSDRDIWRGNAPGAPSMGTVNCCGHTFSVTTFKKFSFCRSWRLPFVTPPRLRSKAHRNTQFSCNIEMNKITMIINVNIFASSGHISGSPESSVAQPNVTIVPLTGYL